MNSNETFPELTREDVEALLAFLPVFQHPDFKSGEWVDTEGQVSWFKPAEAVENFRKTLVCHHWIVPCDWSAWLAAHPNPAAFENLAGAGLEYIRYYLTAIVRADRFNEGTFASEIENRNVTAVLRRLKVIEVLAAKER